MTEAKKPSHYYRAWHFGYTNPDGPDAGNIPLLLRRLADELEGIDSSDILDIVFRSEAVEDLGKPTFIVYMGEPNDA